MDPFEFERAAYKAMGVPVHSIDGAGFIAAVAKAWGRTLYRVHPVGDCRGLPALVPGKAAALATLRFQSAR